MLFVLWSLLFGLMWSIYDRHGYHGFISVRICFFYFLFPFSFQTISILRFKYVSNKQHLAGCRYFRHFIVFYLSTFSTFLFFFLYCLLLDWFFFLFKFPLNRIESYMLCVYSFSSYSENSTMPNWGSLDNAPHSRISMPYSQNLQNCYFTWLKGLWKCDNVKDFEMGKLFWVIWVGPL